jgi:hypothetical protein
MILGLPVEMQSGHPWTGVSVEELRVRWRVLVVAEDDPNGFADVIIDGEPEESIPVVEMLITRWPGSNQEVCNFFSELFFAQKVLRFILKWYGNYWRFQLDIQAPSTDYPNIAQILSAIFLQGFNLWSIVWERGRVPLQPVLPAIRHGIGQNNLHAAGSLPVLTPPLR